MSWVRIDDALPDHPKILAAGLEASWLHVCGIAYCARYETDGVVPSVAIVGLLRGQKGPAAVKKLAAKLVDVGLWKERPDGSFEVHDYLAYNPSKADLDKKRSETRERVKRLRSRVSNGVTSPPPVESNAVTNTTPQPLVTAPQQQQPQDVSDDRGEESAPAAAAADQGKHTEAPAPALVAMLTGHGISVEKATELATNFPERCVQQLAWFPSRNTTKNKAGLLIRSIENDWPKPGNGEARRELPWVGSA